MNGPTLEDHDSRDIGDLRVIALISEFNFPRREILIAPVAVRPGGLGRERAGQAAFVERHPRDDGHVACQETDAETWARVLTAAGQMAAAV